MLDKPPEMFTQGRPVDIVLVPDEELYRRIPPAFWDEPPYQIDVDAIDFINMSVNRLEIFSTRMGSTRQRRARRLGCRRLRSGRCCDGANVPGRDNLSALAGACAVEGELLPLGSPSFARWQTHRAEG